MKYYEPLPGEHINETARTIVSLAAESGETVHAKFNDIDLTANPGDKPEAIVQAFNTESERRRAEYLNSPEYKERQRQAEDRERERNRKLEEGLAAAPATMTLKDEAAWNKSVEANTDPYGSAVTRYAERWARLMESRIAQGQTVQQCADETSHIADTEGITGFMYGCAVGILSQVWTHGEDLRRWHNLKTQIGDEGERANESGGVLNPAVLRLGL